MSSHHVIREKQEPALLVLGMDTFDDELLGQLLEWSPTVMATIDAAEKLTVYGIKLDWVLTDKDQHLQSDVKLLALCGHQPVQAALHYFISNNYPAVNVVTDKFIRSDYLPFFSQINLVVFCCDQKIFAISTGFSKWKPAGETVRLLSQPQNLKIEGLKLITSGIYQTMVDGLYTIHFDAPFMVIAETL